LARYFQLFIFVLLFTLGLSRQSFASEAPQRFYPEVFEPEDRMTLTPGFSPDGQTLYFSQTDCLPIWECPQRLKYSKWNGETWSKPQRVSLPMEARVDYPSVTPDGRYLLFSWQAPRQDLPGYNLDGNFDLWRLDLLTPDAQPEPLIGPDLARLRAGEVRTLRFVNNETAPNLTQDGNLYFWSERLDAIGERDIFIARNDGAGGFMPPQPLPEPINSPARDDGAWVSADGKTMLITYSNRGGCGGSDLFISRLNDKGVWETPKNLGCKINSSADEWAGVIMPDKENIVFVSNREDGVLKSPTYQLWTVPYSQIK